VKATPDKPSGAEIGLAFIEGPGGTLLDLGAAGTIREVANGVQVQATLPASGTWRVVLVCRPDAAARKVVWSFTVKQPTGVAYDVGNAE
jgi:hypothetical protein